MTRSTALLRFLFNSVVPITAAGLLYCIFRSACMKDGQIDYVWLLILCGAPFGIHKMVLWIIPRGKSLGGSMALFVLNVILGGIVGGLVLLWHLIA